MGLEQEPLQYVEENQLICNKQTLLRLWCHAKKCGCRVFSRNSNAKNSILELFLPAKGNRIYLKRIQVLPKKSKNNYVTFFSSSSWPNCSSCFQNDFLVCSGDFAKFCDLHRIYELYQAGQVCCPQLNFYGNSVCKLQNRSHVMPEPIKSMKASSIIIPSLRNVDIIAL